MEVEEKLADDEDESCNHESEQISHKSEEIEENSKSSSMLERYLVDSMDALRIIKTEREDLTDGIHIEASVNNTEEVEVTERIENDDVGSIPEIPASVCRKSKASSLRSVSTIPPEEVKQRVKKEHQKEKKRLEKKRLTVKGEANAVNRKRRENMEVVKQYEVFNEW